jgi:hypothetical protein
MSSTSSGVIADGAAPAHTVIKLPVENRRARARLGITQRD